MPLCLVALAQLARSDAGVPGVTCVAYATFPSPQCASNSDKISLRTEIGSGEDADFSSASNVIVDIVGPNEGGDLDVVKVVTQQLLPGDGKDQVVRANGTVTIVPAVQPALGLRQKDSVVISQATSGVPSLEVDASAGASNQNSGNVVVVADRLQSLSIKANGYNGHSGDDPRKELARKALRGDPDVHPGVAAAYKTRRELDGNLQINFDDGDLNNYAASGLSCRADEKAIGGPGTYAYDTAADPGSVPVGINVTAFAREEAKRSYCLRSPEFAVTQECEAETEYSFQAVCRVQTEARSMKVFKRDPVRWTRPVCATGTDAQVRRKLIRQAHVEISIPGVKSYQGLITREVTIAQTHNIYKKGPPGSDPPWISPFWSQAPNILENGSIQIQGAPNTLTINNGYNNPAAYPERDGEGRPNKAAKLTFVPKNQIEGGVNSLFSFKTEDFDSRAGNVGFGIGCGALIDAASDPRYAGIKAEEGGGTSYRVIADADVQKYVNFYQAFDSAAIGFSHSDLNQAIIKVTNCIAFEVMDGIVQGEVVYGDWAQKTGNGEALSPPPPTATDCTTVDGFENQVGTETLVQYEAEEACYVDDPRTPPLWRQQEKCVALGLPADCNVRQSSFEVSDLYSKVWNKTTGTGAAIVTVSQDGDFDRRHLEFAFPASVTEAEKQAMTKGDYKRFCVPIDQNVTYTQSNQTSTAELTRAIPVPKFVLRQEDNIAIPTSETKLVCPAGIRLDVYLSSVPRPTCPVGSSSFLKNSKWSSLYGEDNWQTWTQRGANSIVPERNFSTRSEIVDTRYDDLPSQIFTTRTHEVHPGVFVPGSASFTGQPFPPIYKDSTGTDLTEQTADGIQRLTPGWTREKSLKNRQGAFVTPSTFTPFDGATFYDRSVAWCNANAFEQVGGSIVRGLGAKGIMRDTPKRVFGFKLENWDPTTETKIGDDVEYVGIEIVADGAQGASRGFYSNGVYAGVNETSAVGINGFLGAPAFASKSYPFLGSRFMESCQPGEIYNEFTGFCHAIGAPWKSSHRVVQRVLHDGTTKEPWAFTLTESKLTDPTDKLDYPFCTTPLSCATRGPTEVDINTRILDIYRLGFMRPLANMADGQVIKTDIFMNRPESVDQMVLSPGFASSMSGAGSPTCMQRFRMIAVPVPTSVTTPISINTNNSLPAGSIFLAVDTECPAGQFAVKATMRRLAADGSVEPSQISLVQTAHEVGVGGDVRLILRNGQPRTLFVLKDIKESLNAGLSATTGFETLEVVEVASPMVRNRSGEWTALRKKGGKGWQTRIKTSPTEPSQEQNVQPLACSPDNLARGEWSPSSDVDPAVTNGSSTLDCASDPLCALSKEEITLFTKPVANTKSLRVTRDAAVQFTPWTHEIAPNAPRDPNYASTKPLGQWTQIIGGQDGAPVPSCEIYDGIGGATDVVLQRASFDLMPKVLDSPLYKVKKPNDLNVDFMVLPENDHARRSESCVRWDSVSGASCEVFYPTAGGPDAAGLIFGGKWQSVFVETKERLAQTCHEFEAGVGGVPTATCRSGSDVANVPYREAKGSPRVEFCTPTTCAFQTNSQSFQVEASIPVSGLPGEDGSNSGSATVFCRDCRSISFEGKPGSGGLGTNPISSQRSKTLTCASWNNNPLAPIFSVRNLWSQPFVGGTAGQNGRPGASGGDVKIYSDMSPEAIWMIGREEFWVPRKTTE